MRQLKTVGSFALLATPLLLSSEWLWARQPHPVVDAAISMSRSADRFSRELDQAHALPHIQREADRLRMASQRLEQEVQQAYDHLPSLQMALQDVQRSYRLTRSEVFRGSAAPTEEVMDSWDSIVVRLDRLVEVAHFEDYHPGPGPGPGPFPPPPPSHGLFEVSGRIETVNVSFRSETIQGIIQDCERFLGMMRISYIDEVVGQGRLARKPSGFWTNASACTVLALQAESTAGVPVLADGSVETIPFKLHGFTKDEAVATLNATVAALGSNDWIDEITVNGTRIRKPSGYFSAAGVAAVIAHNIEGARERFEARGNIEGVTFVFQAHSSDQLFRDCLELRTKAMDGMWVDELVVNGIRQRAGSGYWSPEQTCSIVQMHAN